MSKGMLTVGIIFLSLIALFVINVIQSYSSGSELDYYLLKETTQSSMIDAVDEQFFRITGQVRMDKEKFVESFLRRFAASVRLNRDYNIKFYDLNETPPKVSVKIDSSTMYRFPTSKGTDNDNLEIDTKLTMILTTNNKTDQIVTNWNKTCGIAEDTDRDKSCFTGYTVS